MRSFFTYFLFLQSIILYSQSFDLGSQITNGVTTGGCESGCQLAGWCDPVGTGNHAVTTSTMNITVPAGEFLSMTITSNNDCTASGLDGGDGLTVNGVSTGTYGSNAQVNYTGCFENNSTSDYDVPVSLISNRRDETVHVDYTITSTDPGTCALLPVKYISFTGRDETKRNILNWETASEVNNSHFVVEKSTDGLEFVKIGEVQGRGFTQNREKYEYVDEDVNSTVSFYQLRQVDFDGNFSLSFIVIVVSDYFKNSLRIGYNSSDNNLFIDGMTDTSKLNIFNISGQVVYDDIISEEKTLSLDFLHSGIYVAQIIQNGFQKTLRFVVP